MVILKGIPRILSPQLLNVLARMGHGDEIVLADANFPSASICRYILKLEALALVISVIRVVVCI